MAASLQRHYNPTRRKGAQMDADQRHQLKQVRRVHLQRFRALELQAAALGLQAPPHIGIEMADVQAKIMSIDAQLGIIAAARYLRAPVPDFKGRMLEIDQIWQILSQANGQGSMRGVSIWGMGGSGKTELAYAAAQNLAPYFPDGQVLIDLRGTRDEPLSPVIAIQTIIRVFDIEVDLPDDLGQLQGYYHATLSGKRVLILADDALNSTQVKPLIPPTGCALLLTSRKRFTVPKVVTLDLGMLAENEAVQLILEICPRIQIYAPALAKRCSYLPLALRVGASVLANNDTRSIPRYIEQLDTERLRCLRDPDNPNDPEASVEASLFLSYEALGTEAQTALCQLSVCVFSFDLATANAVVVGVGEVENLLDLLRRNGLLEWEISIERYKLHDLVRAFVSTRLSEAERKAASQRYSLDLAMRVGRMVTSIIMRSLPFK
jgi:hypothetical protein